MRRREFLVGMAGATVWWLCEPYELNAAPTKKSPFKGTLKINPQNPYCFTDDDKRAIYLTGPHTHGRTCRTALSAKLLTSTPTLIFSLNTITTSSGCGLGNQQVLGFFPKSDRILGTEHVIHPPQGSDFTVDYHWLKAR